MPAPSPFVVFALPRSRTYWTATWLARASGREVAHDLAIHANSVQDLLNWLSGCGAGTVETGLMEGAGVIRRALPNARFAVILRDLEDVMEELALLGVPFDQEQLEARDRALRDLALEPGVAVVSVHDLNSPMMAAGLLAHLLPGVPFNWELWKATCAENLQIDMASRLALLRSRAQQIAELKLDFLNWSEAPRPYLWVGAEPVAQFLPDVGPLAAAHHDEAKGDEPEGPLALDGEAMAQLEAARLLSVFTARLDGRLVGYCIWTKSVSIESLAPPTAIMGPLYVSPDQARRGIGRKLLDVSIGALRLKGFAQARLHHTLKGRGASAGSLYRRVGAAPYQHEYLLPLLPEGPPDA